MQAEKALLPIEITEFGIVTALRLLQSEKQEFPIAVSSVEIDTVLSLVHVLNVLS